VMRGFGAEQARAACGPLPEKKERPAAADGHRRAFRIVASLNAKQCVQCCLAQRNLTTVDHGSPPLRQDSSTVAPRHGLLRASFTRAWPGQRPPRLPLPGAPPGEHAARSQRGRGGSTLRCRRGVLRVLFPVDEGSQKVLRRCS